MSQPFDVQAVELLAISAGVSEGKPIAVLTLRHEPGKSFESVNIAFSKAQADRLRKDLDAIFESSPLLRNQEGE